MGACFLFKEVEERGIISDARILRAGNALEERYRLREARVQAGFRGMEL